MKLLDEHLGKALSAEEVADYIGCDVKTVRKHYEELGGMRLGRHYLFFERSLINAVSKGTEMDCPSAEGREAAGEGLLDEEGGASWEVKMRRKPVSDWNEKTATVCLGDWAQAYLDYAQKLVSPKPTRKNGPFPLLLQGNISCSSRCESKTRRCVELHRQAKRGAVWLLSQQGPEEPCGGLELGDEVHEAATARAESLLG